MWPSCHPQVQDKARPMKPWNKIGGLSYLCSFPTKNKILQVGYKMSLPLKHLKFANLVNFSKPNFPPKCQILVIEFTSLWHQIHDSGLARQWVLGSNQFQAFFTCHSKPISLQSQYRKLAVFRLPHCYPPAMSRPKPCHATPSILFCYSASCLICEV